MQNLFNFLAGFPAAGVGQGTFEQTYQCYSVAMCDRHHLEQGGKIILPPSALQQLANLTVSYPLLFRLWNANGREDKYTHAGVLEFVAPEGLCYLPFWMMQNLHIEEGGTIRVKNVTLRSGQFVKLQPHSSSFLDISQPRAVLEKLFREFSALTEGDVIPIRFNQKVYSISILEVSSSPNAATTPQPPPSGAPRAVSIVDTDLQVDFAPPLDYVPPQTRPQPINNNRTSSASSVAFTPSPTNSSPSFRPPNSPPTPSPSPNLTPTLSNPSLNKLATSPSPNTTNASEALTGPQAFVGTGFRLDGKPIRQPSQPSFTPTTSTTTTTTTTSTPSTSTSNNSTSSSNLTTKIPSSTSVSASSNLPKPAAPNRLVFGQPAAQSPAATAKASPTTSSSASSSSQSSSTSTPAPTFVPFSGKGYSLQ